MFMDTLSTEAGSPPSIGSSPTTPNNDRIERSPDEPLILAGYALACVRRWFFGGAPDLGLRARAAAERAVAVAPDRAEARLAMASVFFHSGDLAKIDDEGLFYFCGRKKASIRRRGENISAWEIETAVNQHPSVLESAAYAVPSDLGEDEVKDLGLAVMAAKEGTPNVSTEHAANG